MRQERIAIQLPNGDSLVAEVCPREGGQIAVGIMKDDIWIQDLVVVETADKDGEYIKDKYNVYVYGNENDECYSEHYEISRASIEK